MSILIALGYAVRSRVLFGTLTETVLASRWSETDDEAFVHVNSVIVISLYVNVVCETQIEVDGEAADESLDSILTSAFVVSCMKRAAKSI